ncbi:MAG: N-acetylglucosamine-6-phosphate deacetylase [Candidatus Limnocylindria bacterium]
MDLLLSDARVVTPVGILDPGWVRVRGSAIDAIGSGAPPLVDEQRSLAGRWIVPGFIDLHVHGGGGASMLTRDPAEVVAAAAFHASHGTTRIMASLVSAPLDATLAGLAAVRDATNDRGAGRPVVLGSHLEGPFINPDRGGAHDPDCLLAPDVATFARMLEAADGTLRVITIAPELPGAPDLIRQAVAAGVIVALGHSEADRATAEEAFDLGASLVTHLFNAMRPIDHRAPVLATSALTRAGVSSELIVDGIHLHDDIARLALAAAPGRVALVTDALPAAGLGDGEHVLGTRGVTIRHGVARMSGTTTLAGSTLTMDRAFRRVVADLGLSPHEASDASSGVPARVLGLGDVTGALAAGRDADLVVLDDALEVAGVMVRGEWTASGRLFNP